MYTHSHIHMKRSAETLNLFWAVLQGSIKVSWHRSTGYLSVCFYSLTHPERQRARSTQTDSPREKSRSFSGRKTNKYMKISQQVKSEISRILGRSTGLLDSCVYVAVWAPSTAWRKHVCHEKCSEVVGDLTTVQPARDALSSLIQAQVPPFHS